MMYPGYLIKAHLVSVHDYYLAVLGLKPAGRKCLSMLCMWRSLYRLSSSGPGTDPRGTPKIIQYAELSTQTQHFKLRK